MKKLQHDRQDQLRIAAGCSLTCPFCTLGEGREGLSLEDVLDDRVQLPDSEQILVTAGDLIREDMAPVVERLCKNGAVNVNFYAHSGIADPGALISLKNAGLTGVHLVLPSAERNQLAALTGGKGSLARTAEILDGVKALSLGLTLEIPVVAGNFEALEDIIHRVLKRTGHLDGLLLRFLSEVDRGGRRRRWNPGRAQTSVENALKLARSSRIPVSFGQPDAPPPCLLRPLGLVAGVYGDLATQGDVSGEFAGHPFAVCTDCAAQSVCHYTDRHFAIESGPHPEPLLADEDPDEKIHPSNDPSVAWVDSAKIWVRRNQLRTLRAKLLEKRPICLNPWTNLETHSVNGVAISCATHRFTKEAVEACTSWHDTTLLNAWNSQGMRDIRHAMLSGQPHSHCRKDCVAFHGGEAEDGWLTADPLTKAFFENLMTNLQEIADGAEVLGSRPQHLVIAPSLRCNIDCIMCRFPGEIRDAPDKSRIDMTDRQFDEVLQILPTLRVLNVTGGEPLVARRTRELIRAFSYDEFPDGGIVLTTNGILMDKDFINDVQRSRFLKIIVSLNATKPKTYQYVTRKDAFHTVVTNVRALVAAKPNFPVPPKIVLSMVLMKSTWHELGDFLNLAKEIGTDIQLLPMVGELAGESPLTDPAEIANMMKYLDETIVPTANRYPRSYQAEIATLRSTIARRVRDQDYSHL